MTSPKFSELLFTFFFLLTLGVVSSYGGFQFDINGPAGSPSFGQQIHLLSNGNFVVTDREFSPPGVRGGDESGFGAVYLYNGKNGQLISTLTGSQMGDQVGNRITVLPNGNFVVQSDRWINGGVIEAGAVTFCNGLTGCNGVVSTSNSLVGTLTDDSVGGEIRVLDNGNFAVISRYWNNGTTQDVGAITFCNGATGCPIEAVSSSNSLIGSTTDDTEGQQIVNLPNGDFVVKMPLWDNGDAFNAGAAIWCSGTTGCSGVVSDVNSLVGVSDNDVVGNAIYPLSGGRYAIVSTSFTLPAPLSAKTGGSTEKVGAVTFCSTPGGCVGTINSTNSLLGTSSNDSAGSGGVYELANGKFVVLSANWDNGVTEDAGAATICDTVAQCVGDITTSNSLHGTGDGDAVGSRLLVLPNGNYVVQSIIWKNGLGNSAPKLGAATFCDGTTGCTGPVTTSNSLHGSNSDDRIGFDGIVLPNGNYVLFHEDWEPDGMSDVGAVTFCSGTTGCSGEVSASNSLIGIDNGDRVGNFGHEILANGNFVIPSWEAGTNDHGAVTFCSGVTGCPTGQINSSNSLIGGGSQDRVGGTKLLALDNGNYVVMSPQWDRFPASSNVVGGIVDAGAVTFCNGTTGCVGQVSETNSVVGSNAGDQIGRFGFAVGQNYIFGSAEWDNGADIDVGAVRFCLGTTGCVGEVSETNSLVGANPGDRFGSDQNETQGLPNGDFVIVSNGGGNFGGGSGGIQAVTYGTGSVTTVGQISSDNTVFATNPSFDIPHGFDEVNDQLIIGRPGDQIVTIFRNAQPQSAPFDFDGDGRSDLSVFRGSEGNWYLNQSTEGFLSINHGLAGDELTPADYDGDGQTDFAVWRPDAPNVAAYYILHSSNFTLRVETFGQTGDDPIVVGDWDGDGKADPAVYRDSASGSQSRFYYLGSDNNPGNNITFLDWGTTGDEPLKGDFDGDGKQDLAVFRPSDLIWYIRNSDDNSLRHGIFGFASDRRLNGDFDGDGKTDLAVFRPSENNWYWQQSSTDETFKFQFGIASDQLTPGDYDGDGKTDPAVYRDGVWFISETSSGSTTIQNFGIASDTAVPSTFVGD